MSYTEHPLPDPLPARACRGDDLFVDRVDEGREYRGHKGECENCGTEYSESDDSDLSNTHWMHSKKVHTALWERDTEPRVKAYAKVMDPDDPWDATEHAKRLIEHGNPVGFWL